MASFRAVVERLEVQQEHLLDELLAAQEECERGGMKEADRRELIVGRIPVIVGRDGKKRRRRYGSGVAAKNDWQEKEEGITISPRRRKSRSIVKKKSHDRFDKEGKEELILRLKEILNQRSSLLFIW